MDALNTAHIRRSIFSMVLLFAAIAILSICWYGYQEYNTTVQNATQGAANDSKMLAEHAARTFGEVDSTMHTVLDHLQFTSNMDIHDEKQAYKSLAKHQKELPQVVSLFLVNSKGTLEASTLSYPIKPINLSEREYFTYYQLNPEAQFYISKPFQNKITGKTVFAFTRRLTLPDGSFGGIIAATINNDYFQSIYKELFSTRYNHFAIARLDGVPVISLPSTNKTFLQRSASLSVGEFNTRILHKPNGTTTVYDNEDGKSTLVGYALLPGQVPLVAIVESHWQNMLSGWSLWIFENVFLTLLLMAPLYLLYRRMVAQLKIEQQKSDEISLLSRIVQQSPVTVVLTDTDGALSYVNDRFCELTGYSREEAMGQNPRILKSDGTPVSAYSDMWQNLTNGKEWRGELCNKKKNNELYWEMAYIFPVYNSEGVLTHYAGIKEDITTRKNIEFELERARKVAEEANRSKSLFLATMSHEIRTPMNAVLGMTHLVLMSKLDKKQRDYLEKVTEAGNSLLGIINDILDFSKVEAGKMELESVPTKLDELLESVGSIISITADQKKVALKCRISPDVPNEVVADPVRLRQIILNLAANAVKFTEHGEVTITLRRASRLTDDGMTAIQCLVKDTGIGMTDEQMEKIFAPFTQADSSITRKYGGTGLGLAIVKKLLELMGSSLEVVSHIGKGSCFSFVLELPKCCPIENEHESLSNKAMLPTHFHRQRILLAEDNPVNLIIAREMLKKLNLVVVTASTGKELVHKALTEGPFDLVITDIQMPELDGGEASSIIRQSFDSHTLPIVAITGFVMPEELKQLESYGINDFIAKPIDPEELRKVLAGCLKTVEFSAMSTSVPIKQHEDKSFPLVNLPGLNLVGACNRLGDDCNLLMTLLADARPVLTASINEILELLNSSGLDTVRLKFQLHTLAGSSANLGGDKLAASARALETYLTNPEQDTSLSELVGNFTKNSTELLASLEKLSEAEAASQKEEVEILDFDETIVAPLLIKLREQLQQHRGSALTSCRELLIAVPGLPHCDQLASEIKRFDFNRASHILDEILKEIRFQNKEKQ